MRWIWMVNLSFPRTELALIHPLPPALVDVPGGHIQPLCSQIELYPNVEEEGLFCLGWEVFLEEMPSEYLKDRMRKARKRTFQVGQRWTKAETYKEKKGSPGTVAI
jgi:hypothetical protein